MQAENAGRKTAKADANTLTTPTQIQNENAKPAEDKYTVIKADEEQHKSTVELKDRREDVSNQNTANTPINNTKQSNFNKN